MALTLVNLVEKFSMSFMVNFVCYSLAYSVAPFCQNSGEKKFTWLLFLELVFEQNH